MRLGKGLLAYEVRLNGGHEYTGSANLIFVRVSIGGGRERGRDVINTYCELIFSDRRKLPLIELYLCVDKLTEHGCRYICKWTHNVMRLEDFIG